MLLYDRTILQTDFCNSYKLETALAFFVRQEKEPEIHGVAVERVIRKERNENRRKTI